MPAARRRSLLLAIAAACYGAVFAGLCVLERPGLGVGHFFYVPVVLVATVTGPFVGLFAGVAAAALYTAATVINEHIPSSLEWLQVLIRLTTFSTVGLVVGTYARANHRLVAELSRLASRDKLTGLPNTRAFESAIDEFLAAGADFTLLVGDVDELRKVNDNAEGDDLLRRVADLLSAAKRPHDVVARIGGDEFAVLTPRRESGRALALPLERIVSLGGASATFGWATFPRDGVTALALYRAADERLYARKVARGYRRGPDVSPAATRAS